MSLALALAILVTLGPGFVPLLTALVLDCGGPCLEKDGCRLVSVEYLVASSYGRFTPLREELPVDTPNRVTRTGAKRNNVNV